MSPTGDITYESQLFRAYDAPTAADRIRNPCYHATVRFRIQRFNQLNKRQSNIGAAGKQAAPCVIIRICCQELRRCPQYSQLHRRPFII